MKQLLIRSGSVFLKDVPAPTVGPKNILVQLHRSCVSVGTEMAGVKMSGLPLYRRALKQPDHVKKALQLMKEQGVMSVYRQIKGKLDAGTAIGYSAAGEVIAIGRDVEGLRVGDRVACAGAGLANHAEIVDIPVNLACRLPDNVDFDHAATVTLGAIAMQGVRRTAPTLGETVVVFGLGILGQLTAQLLAANGCRVIGTDIDPERITIAEANGLDVGLNPDDGDVIETVKRLTDGYGADAVIVTAAAPNSEIVSQAFQCCRRKARVVLVGDVGLNLNRGDIYQKELDFLVSTSYGPGRYDASYEEGGQDYPIAYVRWTENRNMQEYLRLLDDGRVNLQNMLNDPYQIDQAEEAYATLGQEGPKPLLVLLAYPPREEAAAPVLEIEARPKPDQRVGVAMVGAGGFAQAVHLPNIQKMADDFDLRCVINRTGLSARTAADRFGAPVAATEFDVALNDDSVDLVLIATRHSLHADMTLRALKAGKHVFVEKPLAMTRQDLDLIREFYQANADGPMLITGFNRRFSPAIQKAKQILAERTSPLIINYRMNAGYIAPDHWVHGPDGGGRNIGEACHIYDLFGALTGAQPVEVGAFSTVPDSAYWQRNDNFVATVRYSDGSVCTLTYTAMGSNDHPKETAEIFFDGKVIALHDYRKLTAVGCDGEWSSATVDKGQADEMKAVAKALRGDGEWPISLADQIAATEISLDVEELIAR